jgi:hypothetical protein
METRERIRRAFVVFHLVLGLMLLVGSVQTLVTIGQHDRHAFILGGAEAVAAVLFLVPRTLRIGACLLLGILTTAFAIHLHRGEWAGSLLVYAAGVAFVLVHGSAYRSRLPGLAVY